MDHKDRIIDTLLYSHMYTLMQLHNVRNGFDVKHFCIDKLYNENALNDIMEYRDTYNEVTVSNLLDSSVRRKLVMIIKNYRDELNNQG